MKHNIPSCTEYISTKCPHKDKKKCYLWENIPDNLLGCPFAKFPISPEKVLFT